MRCFFIFFLLISINVNSQDFTTIESLVLSYPNYSNAKKLAMKIADNFKTDTEKFYAAFFWLANNIRYDLKKFYNPKKTIRFKYSNEQDRLKKLQKIKDKIVKDVFLSKKGICEDYAQSFKKICDLLGLKAVIIKGNVRNSTDEIDKVPSRSNHAWNAIKLNNRWIFLDATWAAGYVVNGVWQKRINRYFYNIPKNKIFKTHFPEQKIWQLRIGRMSLEEFYNQPIYNASFLNTEMELIAPKKGIIFSNKDISIKLKNVNSKTKIYYSFKGQRYSKKPSIAYFDSEAVLTIPNPETTTDLYLFINQKLALQYKIRIP